MRCDPIPLKRDDVETKWQPEWEFDELPVSDLKHEGNQLHWHVRAFFWELVSAFETLLYWLNQTEGLGLEEKDLRWLTIAAQAQKLGKWSERFQRMEDAYKSDWHFQVRQYRKFGSPGLALH